jgi:hypothetical protein
MAADPGTPLTSSGRPFENRPLHGVSGPAPARYDLRDDHARTVSADRLRYGLWGGGLLVFGLFMLLGGIVGRLWLLDLTGLLLTVASGLALYFTFIVGILGLEIGEGGITLERLHQAPFLLKWDDPKLSIDVTEITVDPATLVHEGDPQMIHPQWVFFLHPGRRLTTVPRELEDHLVRAAESHGLSVSRRPVFLFWSGSPRSPSNLTARDLEPDGTKSPNGRVIRLRPRATATD